MAVNISKGRFHDDNVDFGRRKSRQFVRSKFRAQNPGEQLSIEFQKCEAMCDSLHLDRAITTLGFDVRNHHSSRCRRHSSIPPDSRGHTRAKTAPGLLAKSAGSKSDVSKTTSTAQSEKEQGETTSPRITPDVLIKLLTDRGLGRPSWYRYPPAPPEAAISKHYSSFRKISYYMEKLKGRSRIDCELANSKSLAFCEDMRESARAQNRSPSAVFRSRFPEVFINNNNNNQLENMYGQGRSVVGTKTDLNTCADTGPKTDGSQTTEKLAFKRIQTWIEDCELATTKKKKVPTVVVKS